MNTYKTKWYERENKRDEHRQTHTFSTACFCERSGQLPFVIMNKSQVRWLLLLHLFLLLLRHPLLLLLFLLLRLLLTPRPSPTSLSSTSPLISSISHLPHCPLPLPLPLPLLLQSLVLSVFSFVAPSMACHRSERQKLICHMNRERTWRAGSTNERALERRDITCYMFTSDMFSSS
jgi:hypothetical protein